MDASLAPEPNQSRLVVLLLGEKLSGKSSLGNVILGARAFHRKTDRSSRGRAAVCGAQVTVVDTPGWRSPSTAADRVSVELSRGLALCGPEPQVILLVLDPTAPFGPAQWGAMEDQLRRLQTPVWPRALVLFTHGDQLGELPIQDHIRQQGRQLQWLLERCGNRYQVMTDRTGTPEGQLSELFDKIRKMTEANRRPAEIRDLIYARLRREVSLKEARRSRGGREETEMAAMHAGKPGRREPTASGRTWIPGGFPAGAAAGSKPALSLVLLGRRKSGKSSAGNVILGRDEFRVDAKTTGCSAGRAHVWGRAVTVVDSPGWSRFGLADPREVRLEIGRTPALCPAGRPAFLLAVPVDAFGGADRSALEAYVGVLGPAAWSRAAVLFTYGEQLGGRRLQEHVEREGRPLRRLLDRCGGRCHVLDHTGGSVEQLLEMVERLEGACM